MNDPLTALLIFFLTIGSLYALGMMFSSLFMLYGREAWHTANLLQEPIQFLSGTYYPTTSQVVPHLVQLLSSLIPLTFGLDGIRRIVILGQGIGDVWLNILALVIFTAILLPLARLSLRYMENLGKKEGRLTLRWQ
jgi:ABC-2 type transport system permease protein